MTDDRRREILADNHRMAAQALRVLAAASRPWPDGAPEDQSPAHLEELVTGNLFCRDICRRPGSCIPSPSPLTGTPPM